MKKNFAENFQSVQVDPITGEYYITLPESVVNELEWYEDTSVRLTIEGNELIITEDAKNG
jgi:hypothetical protein